MPRTARRRTIALALVAVTALLLTAAPAKAQDPAPLPGVGRSGGATSVVRLLLGDLDNGQPLPLDLRLIGEESTTITDTPPASALERLLPLTISSALEGDFPGLLESLTVPAFETSSTGAQHSEVAPALDLATLTGGQVTGLISLATLSSVVDSLGAKSLLTSQITDLSALGLISVDEVLASLGSNALSAESITTRGLSADRVELLDVEGLLALLGINLGDLPLGSLTGLLAVLGLDAPGGLPLDLAGTVDGLLDQVDALVAGLAPGVCQTVIAIPVLGDIACGDLQAALDDVRATLDGIVDLLPDVLGSIGGSPLLALTDLELDVLAQALPTVDASRAETHSSLGGVELLGAAVPGVAIGEALDELTTTVLDGLNSVLAAVSPELVGLLDISLLGESTSIFEQDGFVNASSSLTALSVTLAPATDVLCGVLGGLGGQLPVGTLPGIGDLPISDLTGLLGDLGSILDCNAGADLGAQGLVDGLAAALTLPLTVQALSIQGTARFAALPAAPAAPAAPAQPTLPETGGSAQWAILAAGGLGLALLLRRWVRGAA